jgi:hypothetical protein
MSEAGNKHLWPEDQQARTRQKQLETWATDRVKPWSRKLRVDDYDFRSWATRASKNCLQAGAVYEYARESRKLRALLVLMNPNRHREAWEIVRPGSINGRRPEPNELIATQRKRVGSLARSSGGRRGCVSVGPRYRDLRGPIAGEAVVTLATPEYPFRLPVASLTRTR